MKKQLLTLIAFGTFMLAAVMGYSQTPYISEMYSYTKVANVIYDTNRSVNIFYGVLPGEQPIINANLRCDIYKPTGGATIKPVVIVTHTGSYLPVLVNRQATGSKDDSAIVELCSKLAKRGFIAVAMNYRLGWNAASTVQADATEQLLKATYRGIQDVRNCIRYLRANATTHGIDTSKIIVGGQGTGGYISLALGSIERDQEIENIPKFQRSDFTPMVNVDTLGDWMGLGGYAPFCTPGDPAISGNAHMTFNVGGAMGDLSWLEASSLPVVSIQTTTDPFAPYNTGNVVVPTTGTTVIPSASGAGVVIPKANLIGANAKLNTKYLLDVYSKTGYVKASNQTNLFPIASPTPYDGAPWEWWDRPTVQAQAFSSFYGRVIPADGRAADSLSFVTNPTMSPAKGKAYVDTIVNFIAPRIAVQFDLVPTSNDAFAASYSLLTPATDTRVLVKGDSSQQVNISWEPANTTGFGDLTYTWKLSKGDVVNFAAPVGSGTSVSKPMISFDYTAISGFMANAGIAVGDSAVMKWTVEAELNGNKLWASDTFNIKLIRGQVTAVKEIANVSRYLTVYPNPASNVLNISIDARAGNAATYTLMDVTGRVVLNGNAESNGFGVQVDSINPGLYFMHVVLQDGSYATNRVVIK
jgi:alpha/beta superfamily hydrolase